MDLQVQPIEKNWVPFAYHDAEKGTQLNYRYRIYPNSILEFNPLESQSLKHLLSPDASPHPKPNWPKIWGKPRGGTPAICFKFSQLPYVHFTKIYSPLGCGRINKKTQIVHKITQLQLQNYNPQYMVSKESTKKNIYFENLIL